MSRRRRFVVRRLDAYRKGERRWVVWDRQAEGWADEAQRTAARDIASKFRADLYDRRHKLKAD